MNVYYWRTWYKAASVCGEKGGSVTCNGVFGLSGEGGGVTGEEGLGLVGDGANPVEAAVPDLGGLVCRTIHGRSLVQILSVVGAVAEVAVIS